MSNKMTRTNVQISRNEYGDPVIHPIPAEATLGMSFITWAELLKGAERSNPHWGK